RGARGVDLPPPAAFDRICEGGDGRGRNFREARRMSDTFDDTKVAWPADGLVPAVVQDALDGRVLMLAYMDREALTATMTSGEVHFHSRSRDRLWRKGETSGNVLRLRSLAVDCDGDALLIGADPVGPTCHR